ncbi:Ubiquitin domain [Macleaya cordata]|uniref:Ubiquitin domain n=1 Tax=Macleaya cordata TaxID=56857 RepID=A0A200Q6F2_MACCD|nr:Ubiquitin domain [Macleaya cordata]
MEVIVETLDGREFTIELDSSDTVGKLKEKIQQYKGFPISSQNLFILGLIMIDDFEIDFYQLNQGSRSAFKIQLVIKIPIVKKQFYLDDIDITDTVGLLKQRVTEVIGYRLPVISTQFVLVSSDNNKLVDENRMLVEFGIDVDCSEINVMNLVMMNNNMLLLPKDHHQNDHLASIPSSSSKPVANTSKINTQLVLDLPSLNTQFSLDMDITDTVGQLKQRICEVKGIPVRQIGLLFSGTELVDDNLMLFDYGLFLFSHEVIVFIKAASPPLSSISGCINSANKGTLKRLKLKRIQFHLPTGEYYFFYKRTLMDEDRTFKWHNVRQGGTIEIYGGSLRGCHS